MALTTEQGAVILQHFYEARNLVPELTADADLLFEALASRDADVVALEADRDRWKSEAYAWRQHYTEARAGQAEREEALLAEIARLKTHVGNTSVCTCACHTYPGTYPTSKARPCSVCGHYLGQPTIAGAL